MTSPGGAPSPTPSLGPGFAAQAPGPRFSAPPFSGPPRPAMFTPRLHPPPTGPPPRAIIGGIPSLPPPPLANKPLLLEPPKVAFFGATVEKPYTTVYVGKISPTVDDTFLRNVLGICGEVKSWKRAQDPTTNANKAFGFCEFDNAEGVLRALRLLNKHNLEGQELLINVNKDTREYLERYIAAKENQYFLENAAQEDDVETAPGVEVQPRNPGKDEEAFGIVSERDKLADKAALDRLKQLLEDRARNKPFIRPRSPAKAKDGDHDDDDRMESDRGRRGVDRDRDRERERERARREKDRKDRLRESERAFEELLREWEARERDKDRARMQELDWERERKRERKREVKMQEEESDDDDWKKKRYRASSQEERRRRRQRERDEDISDVMKEQQEVMEAKRRRIEDAQRAVEKAAEEMQAVADAERNAEAAEKTAEATVEPVGEDGERPASSKEDDLLTSNAETADNGACDMVVDDNDEKEPPKPPPPKKLNFGLTAGKRASLPSLFKHEDEEELPRDRQMRTLVPIDYSAEEMQAVAASRSAEQSRMDASQKNQAKQLIDAIPTTKEELFNYPVDWSIYDKHKLDQKIRPWISKKITEFLGEEENTFIDYILQHTRRHMWKMLIFEIRRIETGLAKAT